MRHRQTGDLGILIEKDGDWFVRYARGGDAPEVRYTPELWESVVEEFRPLGDGQRAKVAFEADQSLCYVTGQYSELVRAGFESLRDTERRRWMDPDVPPMDGFERRRLYMFVHRAMTPPERRPPNDAS